MKTLLFVLSITLSLSGYAQSISAKPDFIQKNENGEVVLKGVYTTDDSGYVVRYDLFDGAGNLKQSSIPYYARDGRLLESREYDGDGQLLMVVVFIGQRVVVLDPDGKRIEKDSHQEVDMDGFLKHFRDKK